MAKDKLTRLVLKEITDNALDTNALVKIGELRKKGGYFVEDDGPGIDGTPQDIARLFSIARPLVSSKRSACRPVVLLATACAWLPARSWSAAAPSSSLPAIAASSFAPSVTAARLWSASRRSSVQSAPASRSASAPHCRATTTPCSGRRRHLFRPRRQDL